jgi:hypothetical protein
MKICPRCGQGYTDSSINFCLNDGELLVLYGADEPKTLFSDPAPTQFDDSPPTAVMDPTRITNQTGWQPASPPAPWQGQTPLQNQPYGLGSITRPRDQTLPTIALILGIISCVVVCCYGGIWLGAPAAVIGFLGMKNADSDPTRYAGRGMAIGGMVLGTVTFLISMVILFAALLAR